MDRIRRLGMINGKGQETIFFLSGLVDWKEMVKRECKDTTSSVISHIILKIPTLLPSYAFNFRGISFCGSEGLIPPLSFLLSSHLNNSTVL